MTREWLDQLTPREIVWLMMQLRTLVDGTAWTSTETAEERISNLRRELLERRLTAISSAR
jgi:hypothetical protein